MKLRTVFQKLDKQPLSLGRLMVLSCVDNIPITLNALSDRYREAYSSANLSTLSQSTTALHNEGYVIKSYCSELLDNPKISEAVKKKLGNDRRSTYIYITEEGKNLLSSLEKEFEK